MQKLIRLLALGLVLTACQKPSDGPSKLDHYLDRLSGAIDSPIASTRPGALPRLNSAPLTPLVLPTADLGVLDFLSLSDCALQVNLARRNSSLGRVAGASQRLLLDLEFLRLAPACIDKLRDRGDPDLARQIEAAFTTRRTHLPAAIYNAVLGGSEYRDFWKIPAVLGNYPLNTGGDLPAALQVIDNQSAAWLAGDYRVTPTPHLEDLLATLRSGDGGTLLLAASYQHEALAEANLALGEASPLCPFGTTTQRALTLRNVVAKYFAADTQQWLAELSRREVSLMQPLRALEARLSTVLPREYTGWQQQRDAHLASLRRTPRAHVEAIQAVFRECPGSIAGTQGQ
ncbi:DUF3080 family protein [Luminiphilus syltensis]|uniref:DUF3080 family protein n=1 Tax=Luminiphilus syltensis TaxID=1341119 RepID=UPI0018A858AE|nr:DUF3080 family protein [Luminiphilus syltensis]